MSAEPDEKSERRIDAALAKEAWTRCTDAEGRELYTFAAVTDEPPAEVAAAGHDRCIVPLKPEAVDAWLNPSPDRLGELQQLLEDRERPIYGHRLAA